MNDNNKKVKSSDKLKLEKSKTFENVSIRANTSSIFPTINKYTSYSELQNKSFKIIQSDSPDNNDTIDKQIENVKLKFEKNLLTFNESKKIKVVPFKNKKTTLASLKIENKPDSSLNWSGYASADNVLNPTVGSVTNVIASWKVPRISASTPSANTWCSVWVGIDGLTSNTVQQIGTEHDWSNGKQVNYVWFEMYPNSAFEITGFPLSIDDLITASVSYIGSNTYQLFIMNNTKKISFTVPTKYTKSANTTRTSAEFIVEAPYYRGILPLSKFSTPIQFTSCSATINGIMGFINTPSRDFVSITMKNAKNVNKAVPSALNPSGNSFTVSWKSQQ